MCEYKQKKSSYKHVLDFDGYGGAGIFKFPYTTLCEPHLQHQLECDVINSITLPADRFAPVPGVSSIVSIDGGTHADWSATLLSRSAAFSFLTSFSSCVIFLICSGAQMCFSEYFTSKQCSS
jgi:hypothetical protein